MDDVYYYPGKMPDGNASAFYYVPDLIDARVSIDGTEQNGWDATFNPYPYALADYYNHCMRYPRAKELHDNRVRVVEERRAAILAAEVAGNAPPDELWDMSEEPTLQVLIEEMSTNPDRYRHALIVNLHGELMPVPPLRNYSDAAKRPEALPNVRVVTHPEELRTARPGTAGDTTARFRVYAYSADPDDVPFERLTGSEAVMLEFMGVDLTDSFNRLDSGVQIQKIDGLYDDGFGSVVECNGWEDAPFVASAGDEMSYWAAYVVDDEGPRTLVILLNTPIVARRDANGRGLPDSERCRLYDLEYIPSSPGDNGFGQNLDSVHDEPKNTARWRISLDESIWDDERFVAADGITRYDPRDTAEPDVTFTVRTRFVDLSDFTSLFTSGKWFEGTNGDTEVDEPENMSETYTWWADSIEDVPMTERAQFLGDPRHNPYKDLLTGDADFGDRYNWFFDSLNNDGENARADFPGIIRCWNRWGGAIRQDVPRLFELYRNAITQTRSIFTTLTGYSYYYMGVGNEIGYDGANGYSNSIPTSRKPWGSGDSSTGFVNNITGSRCYIREGGSDYWWGMPWLGELYPDDQFATHWRSGGTWNGNLPTGTSEDQFYRQQDNSCYWNSNRRAYGTRIYSARQRTSTRGCVSFFNIGTSSSHFNHHPSGGSGFLTGPGQRHRGQLRVPDAVVGDDHAPVRGRHRGQRAGRIRLRAVLDRPLHGHDRADVLQPPEQRPDGVGSRALDQLCRHRRGLRRRERDRADDHDRHELHREVLPALDVSVVLRDRRPDVDVPHQAAAARRDPVADGDHRDQRPVEHRHPVLDQLDAVGRAAVHQRHVLVVLRARERARIRHPLLA